MKTLITLILIITPSMLYGQSLASVEIDPFESYMLSQPESPCNDQMYLKLKQISLDEMSQRQYEVFKQKDEACQEYLNTIESTQAEKKNAQTLDRATNAATTFYVIGGIVSLVSLIYLFSI